MLVWLLLDSLFDNITFWKKRRRKTFVINNYVRNYQSRLAIRGTGIPRAFALIKCFACSLWFNDAVWKAALSMFGETERS